MSEVNVPKDLVTQLRDMYATSARNHEHWLKEAADELERLARLFHDACKSMESCACDWAIDPKTGEPTGEHHGIAALCDAHRDYFREHEAAETKRLRALLQLETAALEQSCAAPVNAPLTVEQARAWRPIATAPKDGTDVILLFAREDEMFKSGPLLPRRRAARWLPGAWSVPHFTGNMPTHWAPFPDLPQA